MNKFLTKDEIIQKLQSLPDLPVVFERDTEQLMSTMITSIEVVYANKTYDYEKYGEYNRSSQDEKVNEKVIWIS